MPAYSARARRAGREQDLASELGRLLEEDDAMAAERRHAGRLEPGDAAADHRRPASASPPASDSASSASRPTPGFWTHVTGLPW